MPKSSSLSRAHRFFRYPRFTHLPLGVEIALILVVKIALLTVLAKAFFSEPQAKKMRMPTEKVEQHFLAPAATSNSAANSAANSAVNPALNSVSVATTASAVPSFTSTTEVTHASH